MVMLLKNKITSALLGLLALVVAAGSGYYVGVDNTRARYELKIAEAELAVAQRMEVLVRSTRERVDNLLKQKEKRDAAISTLLEEARSDPDGGDVILDADSLRRIGSINVLTGE